MRIAIIIIGTVLLLAAAGMGFLGTTKSLGDAKVVDAAIAETDGAAAESFEALGLDPSRMKTGGIALAIAGILSLVLIGLMYANKGVPQVAVGLVVVALITIVVAPQYDGIAGGFSPRTFGYVVAVLGALGAASAYGSKVLKERA